MLLIKNGYLSSYGVKFKLPDNFFIDTDVEAVYSDGVEYISPDKKFHSAMLFLRITKTQRLW